MKTVVQAVSTGKRPPRPKSDCLSVYRENGLLQRWIVNAKYARRAKGLHFFAYLFAFLMVELCCANPHIESVLPATQRPGQNISITGNGFGSATGYVTFAALKAYAESWSNQTITVAVPEGASSGNLGVVDAGGAKSDDFEYTVIYSDRVAPEWRITNPDEFGLKDFGYFGAANRIESRNNFLFVNYSSGVATYDTSQTPYAQKSNFYLPSKMADWKIHDDFLYMVGDFGLRIYPLDDLESGIPASPRLCGAFTGKETGLFTTANATFRYVAIQDYSYGATPITHNGEPFNGTLIAAVEFYDPFGSPRIFFFKRDVATETLELLSIYEGEHFLNAILPLQQPPTPPYLPLFRDRKYLFCLAFDPLNPKLYVAAGLRTTHDVGAKFSYLYEFDISAIDSLSVNNTNSLLRIQDQNHVPNDMVVHEDKLWIALYCAFSFPSARAFNGYDLHPGETCVSDRTYIDACHPEDPLQTTHNHLGHLTLVPELDLVIGTTGMSTDTDTLHNIFVFKTDTPTNEHVPLASSESIDWSQDIAATTGKIYAADEWVNVLSLPYTFDGTNANIQHHPEPPWEDTTRIFGGGWSSAGLWEHAEKLYIGAGGGASRLFSIDAGDLGDFSKWRSWNDKWFVSRGQHFNNSNYIFAVGFEENFVVSQDGARLLLIHEDPSTGEFSSVNPSSIPHFPMKLSNLYFNSVNGFSTGLEIPSDNVVIFTIPDHGLFAYYVDSQTTTMQERAHIELSTTGTVAFGYVAQTFTDVGFVNEGILAVTESWVQGSLVPPAPDPDWGGIHLYCIEYPDGSPPDVINPTQRIDLVFTGEVNCLRGYQVDSLATSDDGWVMARIYWEEGLLKNFRTVLFDYADIDLLNGMINSNALQEIMIPLESFVPSIDRKGVRSSCFWRNGRIVVPVGCEQTDGAGKTGVYVFDRETKQQLFYYPAGRTGHAFYDPQHYSYYPDSNVQLVPNPIFALPADNGDLFVGTGWAGQIARLGIPEGMSRTIAIVSPYSNAENPGTGVWTYAYGALLTNSVYSPDTQYTTQYVCTGWTMSGNDPTSGINTNITLTLTNDAVLTWLWKTQYMFVPLAGPDGSVDQTSQWANAGTNLIVTGTASNYYHFVTWTGTISSTSNPLTLEMNHSHSVTACFGENMATNNTPHWWLAQYGLSTNDYAALAHNDTDGMANWEEYIADIDPTNSESVFMITEVTLENDVSIKWKGGILATQILERCTSILYGTWNAVVTNHPPTATSTNWTDFSATNKKSRFYRIKAVR